MADDKDLVTNNSESEAGKVDASEVSGISEVSEVSEVLPPTADETTGAEMVETVKVELSPKSVGIGGALASLGTALSGYHAYLPWIALCPLWLMLALPVLVFLPMLLPIYILWLCQRRLKRDLAGYPNAAAAEQAGVVLPKERVYIQLWSQCKQRLFPLQLLLIAYDLLFAGVIFGAHYANVWASEVLRATIQFTPNWYEPTPEQVLYARHITLIYSTAGALYLLILLGCWSLTFLVLLRERLGLAVILKQGCLLVLKNLPCIAILGVLFYLIIMAIERVYAHCRLVALNNLMLGMDYFDPTLTFIAIRFYVVAVIMMTMILILARGLHLFPERKTAPQSEFRL